MFTPCPFFFSIILPRPLSIFDVGALFPLLVSCVPSLCCAGPTLGGHPKCSPPPRFLERFLFLSRLWPSWPYLARSGRRRTFCLLPCVRAFGKADMPLHSRSLAPRALPPHICSRLSFCPGRHSSRSYGPAPIAPLSRDPPFHPAPDSSYPKRALSQDVVRILLPHDNCGRLGVVAVWPQVAHPPVFLRSQFLF
jgi:hypothetical protein